MPLWYFIINTTVIQCLFIRGFFAKIKNVKSTWVCVKWSAFEMRPVPLLVLLGYLQLVKQKKEKENTSYKCH